MPIKIPDDLPARKTLEEEGIVVIGDHDAIRQDIRPLRIAVLNLMPEKVKTETQIARLIGATPLQVEMSLLTTSSYTPTNTPEAHMSAFYQPWEAVCDQKFDGLFITGAPVEEIEFEEVLYWRELTRILDWAQTNVSRSFNICWGGQAALAHFYDVPKYELPQKMFGVFPHRSPAENSTLLQGFTDVFPVPVSRHTETRREDIDKVEGLRILAYSEEAGLCMIQDERRRHLHMFNHLEYDAHTLRDEFRRDLGQGLDIQIPKYYFPDDDPDREPVNTWRTHAHLFFANWINDMYQTTPFEIDRIGEATATTARKSA